ncbi:MAG: DUF4188 domain-containing protein [Rhodothermales bacterium]|nr:DUF4188 domain-containing protein [Rhodothermales bacterium]
MYTATFTFRIGKTDADFDRLNDAILEAAESNEGFVRREGWVSDDGRTRSVVYYWKSLEDLNRFSNHPIHLEAKRRYREWYEGYEVTVAQVVRQSSDQRL